MSEKMDFAGGKYTVINDNGKLTALRYGEPWGRDEDLVGDNLVYSMLVDSLRLKEQRDALLAALDQLANGTLIHEHTHNDNGLEDLAARCGSEHVAAELRKLAGIARAAIAKAEGNT